MHYHCIFGVIVKCGFAQALSLHGKSEDGAFGIYLMQCWQKLNIINDLLADPYRNSIEIESTT